MHEYFVYKYVCTPHVGMACRSQKKASYLLELELQTVVRCQVTAGYLSGYSGRTDSVLLLGHLSSPVFSKQNKTKQFQCTYMHGYVYIKFCCLALLKRLVIAIKTLAPGVKYAGNWYLCLAYSRYALPLPFCYSGLEKTTENTEWANFSLW